MSDNTNQFEQDAGLADAASHPEDSGRQDSNDMLGTPEEQIARLEAERDAFKDKWLRGEAEMANLRARTRREVEEARLYAVQKFARDVVEAAENLRRGIEALPKHEAGEPALVTKLREGFEGVERSFVALLERNGITGQDPVGAKFDPNLHESMSQQPTDEVPPGTILQAWTRTWLLNGRLLKPAMVVVAQAANHGASDHAPVDTIA
jgi:molecular chaperone GrpE